MDIAFIILHYLNFEDTCDCINSVKKYIDTNDYGIVVVDNNSMNGSFQKIKEIYQEKNIVCIENTKNEGYARGNNKGIKYARKHWKPEYVVILNNDTCLVNNNFYDVISKKYLKYHFAALGPMVLTKDGTCNTNPISIGLPSEKEVLHEIRHYKTKQVINSIGLITMYELYSKIKSALIGKEHDFIIEDLLDVRLNGCCIVFSDIFFEYFDGFDESTFMYFEEAILHLHLNFCNLVSLYTPDLMIFHKECASTNLSQNTVKSKIAFQSKYRCESRQRYLKILKRYQGKE